MKKCEFFRTVYSVKDKRAIPIQYEISKAYEDREFNSGEVVIGI